MFVLIYKWLKNAVLRRGNIVHEVGIYERQGTMWNQALTAGTRLEGNIAFNCGA
jgi:hypothetical protein